MSDSMGAALRNQATRGKVYQTRVGPRTLLQITGLDGVTQQVVELLLPPGIRARPLPESDVLLMQVLGSSDHVVALGGDMAGNAIANLAPGEFGLSDGTRMMIIRTDHIELVSPTYILATTPEFRCSGEFIANYGSGSTTGMASHTHPPGVAGNTGAPNPQHMTDIALVWDSVNGRADFAMNASGTDLLMDDTPTTAVILSLFCDRLAGAGDTIPDGTTDPRGWWGDTPLPNETDPAGALDLTGSHFWLYMRSLQIPQTALGLIAAAKTSLQWMIDDGVAQSVDATAVFPTQPTNAVFLTVTIVLADGTVWSNSFGFPLAPAS